ncbi:MAG: HXXEE domain-containing protein [Anaerolineales bacterium]
MLYAILIWLLPVVILLHELEEWNILHWIQRNFVNLPRKTHVSIRTFLVFFSLLSFVWTFLATRLASAPATAILVGLLGLATLLNAFQHIYYQFHFREYAPGVITSLALTIPLVLALFYQVVALGILPWWAVAGVSLPVLVFGMIETVRAGNRLPVGLRATSRVGAWLASALRLE